MENLTGKSLKGYELLDRIGSGGFGVVYRAYQSTIGREVAVKIILPHFANHPDFIRQFEAEAQLIARLEHLHIVPLYDYWRDPHGTYLVMRWLRGGSVKDALTEEPFDLEPAAILLDQVAAGLAVAHGNGVVHRDLKPSNILLDEEGNAYLADFGIAKDLRQARDLNSQQEYIVGSLNYLSPEQARSEPVTARSDIYSLGITLYEMLTGENPFHELNMVDRLYKHINDPLPRVETLEASVADQVNDVIQRATAKNPKHRYADALEMASAFRTAARLAQDSHSLEVAELLTLREKDVLRLIVEGQTNRQIAQSLYIEHTTVKWYVRQIYRKLGVRSRRQAIVRAREMKLLTLDSEADSSAEAAPGSVSVALPAPANPYKGLRAFEAADRREYFGRELLVKVLLYRLTLPPTSSPRDPQPGKGRFLAVVGPSGSGKSSLVKAGLIPALWRGDVPGSEHWFVVEMTPGARPMDELEVALIRVAANQADNVRAQLERDKDGLLRASELILPKDGSELVLVIDQFEELFTLVQDEADQAFFLEILTAAVTDPRSRVRTVLTLRADFYDRPLHYPEFGRLVQNNMETVMPLSAQELELAIARPAEQVNVTLEPGLVTTIIDEALYQPGALPLLQYALTELFEQRDGRILTHQAYEEIGRVTGALASRAEELYLEQDVGGQEAIRQTFMRLVSVDRQANTLPNTRRKVPLSELLSLTADEEMVEELIDIYTTYRLLTLDHDPVNRHPTVEVAHEALLREWERLRLWLEDSRDDLYQHRRLQTLTDEWLANDRDPGLLLRETRLDHFAAWAANADLALTTDELDFLEISQAARQDRRAEEEARRRRELETAQMLAETERRRAEEQVHANRRMRLLAAGLAVLLLAATVAALFAWQQNQRAEQQARLATARELAAAAISNLTVDPERSILLALQAAETTSEMDGSVVPEAEDALHRAVQASRTLFTVPGQGAVAYSPDGMRLATSGVDGAELWDSKTGEKLMAFSGHTDQVRNIAFSGDGRRLATSSLDDTVKVWDVATGELLLTVNGPPDPEELMSPALNPDGSLLAATGSDGAVRLWQVPSGDPLLTLRHEEFSVGIAFSPDGARLATASFDDTARIWDIPSGRELLTLSGHNDDVNDVAFSPDGSRLATASSDGSARVWDATTGEALTSVIHGAWVFGVDFGPGDRFATGGQDGIARLWDATSGREVLALASHAAGISNVSLSPDGTRLASGGDDGVTRVWDITPEGSREWLTLAGHGDLVFSLAYSPHGTRLASASWDGTARVWDANSGENVLTLAAHPDRVSRITFSPDGARLATASYDGSARIWDAITGAELLTVEGNNGPLFGADFSPDGALLATAADDGTVTLWEADSGAKVRSLDAHSATVFRAAFSPDGQRLVTAGWDGTAKIWELASGEEKLALLGHEGGVNQVAFSSDGALLATAGFDGMARVWDASTGQELLTLSGHTDTVWDVAFSPDDSRLATAGFDGLTKLWDAGSGEELLTLAGHVVGPELAFNLDGTRLATAGADGTVRVYVLPIEELMDLARARVTRSLTPAECRQFLHLDECPPG